MTTINTDINLCNVNTNRRTNTNGPGSSVGIATDNGLDDPGSNPCTMCTGSFPGVKCGRGVLLTTHHLIVPRSRKSRAIPLPTLWATPGL